MKTKLGLALLFLMAAIFFVPTTAKASPVSGLDNLVASTFLGGSGDESTLASMAVSSGGSIYILGQVDSTNFPTTTGVYQIANGGGYDAVIAKFNANLTSLEAATYLGGSGTEIPYSVVLDSSGKVFVTGKTASTNFPTTTGAYQGNRVASDDAFVVRFNAGLTSLEAATYLGGTGADKGWRIALDPTESFVYVAGRTASTNFPTTTGAFQTSSGGGNEIFVSKLNIGLTTLAASSYLGGSGSDLGVGVAVDATGSVFVAGYTASTNFPTTTGAYQTTLAGGSGNDVFITKFNSGLTSTLASTYLGGTGSDVAYAVSLDTSGNVHLTGQTASTNFPTTTGAYQGTFSGGTYDGFITKFNSDLSSLDAATYIGGNGDDMIYFSLADSAGNIYTVGSSPSTNFPTTTGAYQGTNAGGASDVVLMEFNSTLTQLLGSTYLGGSGNDSAYFMGFDATGNIYINGYTDSSANFPTTTGAYQGTYGGGLDDLVLVKFGNPVPTISSISPTSTTSAGTSNLTLTVNGTGYNASSTVKLSGSSLTTTYVSSTQITAVIPTASLQTNGDIDITVTNPQPGGGTTASTTFTLSNPTPTITSFSPVQVYSDNGPLTLTINGTGFNISSTVSYGGVNKTATFVSSVALTISLTSEVTETDGTKTVPITVANPTPGGGTSTASNFLVLLKYGSGGTSAPVSGASVTAPVSTPSVATPVVITPVAPAEMPLSVSVETKAEPLIAIIPPDRTPVSVTSAFKRNLKTGNTGADVKKLQIFLNTHGFKVAIKGAGSPSKETTFFGVATRTAIMKFQKANKIKPVNGLFGPLTRAKINGIK